MIRMKYIQSSFWVWAAINNCVELNIILINSMLWNYEDFKINQIKDNITINILHISLAEVLIKIMTIKKKKKKISTAVII